MDFRAKQLREKYLNHPICKLESPFVDDRGAIIPLVDEKMQSCVIIESKKGSVRANHFHKTDWHYCYVLKGAIEYYYRPTGSEALASKVLVKQGECFFTPPLVDHAMYFPEDTTFICLGRNPRDQASYESDIERVMVHEA